MKRQAIRARLAAEGGFTMIIALGVMLVTSLLCAAAFVAVESDARVVGHDLNGKRAYAAAQAGVQAFLFSLNQSSINGSWETCTNDVQATTTVPGSTTGVTYSWGPVVPCPTGSNTNSLASLIDSAGNLRLEFVGTAGTGTNAVTRTIVASFRTDTPLSYLWYTVHETLDPAADGNCAGLPFYYQMTSTQKQKTECQLNWITGDSVNGPLYTQDQLLIANGQAPAFQSVTSAAPYTASTEVCVSNSCGSATFTSKQTVEGGGQSVPFPSDNSNLVNDASSYGKLYSGTTSGTPAGTINIVLNRTNMTIYSCPTSTCTSSGSVPISSFPIIYANSASGCNTAYSPNETTYTLNSDGHAYGPCGDIYVSGTYSSSLTLAAANDIVVTSSILNCTDDSTCTNGVTTGMTAPTGTATLGLVANEYVRIDHPASFGWNATTCTAGTAPNPNVTIDAAILTLQHSFMVDNYECGQVITSSTGELTVHGAIAQEYRGAVGQSNNLGLTGYLKNYNYDSRLATLLPPYMFDLESTQWSPVRETLCTGTTSSGTCSSTS
jgi:Tfp pilus assembly protein PilX